MREEIYQHYVLTDAQRGVGFWETKVRQIYTPEEKLDFERAKLLCDPTSQRMRDQQTYDKYASVIHSAGRKMYLDVYTGDVVKLITVDPVLLYQRCCELALAEASLKEVQKPSESEMVDIIIERQQFRVYGMASDEETRVRARIRFIEMFTQDRDREPKVRLSDTQLPAGPNAFERALAELRSREATAGTPTSCPRPNLPADRTPFERALTELRSREATAAAEPTTAPKTNMHTIDSAGPEPASNPWEGRTGLSIPGRYRERFESPPVNARQIARELPRPTSKS